MTKSVKKRMRRFCCLLLALMLPLSLAIADEEPAMHPLIEPNKLKTNVVTKDRYTNILLLGVDYGFDGYWGSYHKKVLEECHTDAFIVLSINMTQNTVNMISVPRDTVTYVPGVQGLYKLNAAFNCGDTLEQGFKRACDAASWILGGIRIDYYACVDMNAMIALGDYIGGADIDVEMDYTSVDRRYEKGLQHLDGRGLMDYARARKNATVNGNDLGRTSRQRQVVAGIMKTLAADVNLIRPTWNFATKGEINFFTNLKLGTLINLFNKVKDVQDIGSYLITGTIRNAANWNFTFTDQENRRQVICDVFGIEVPELEYVDYDSVMWLQRSGFNYVHAINLAKDILSFGNRLDNRNTEQETSINDLSAAYECAVEAFNTTAAEYSYDNNLELKNAVQQLISVGNKASKNFGYSNSKLDWDKASSWNDDPFINEYTIVWH